MYVVNYYSSLRFKAKTLRIHKDFDKKKHSHNGRLQYTPLQNLIDQVDKK